MVIDKKIHQHIKVTVELLEKKQLQENSFWIREYLLSRGVNYQQANLITKAILKDLGVPFRPNEPGLQWLNRRFREFNIPGRYFAGKPDMIGRAIEMIAIAIHFASMND